MTGNIPAETAWEIARLGKFTSSRIDELLTEPRSAAAKKAGLMGETAMTYIKSRAAEIITGTSRQVTNWAMEWGNTYEPIAAEKLGLKFPGMEYMGKENPVFFPYSDFSGGSPDGRHLDQKLVFEIKCPENPENHVEYCLLKDGLDLKASERGYYHQIQMNMICVANEYAIPFSEMKAVFASYCPIVNDPYPDMITLTIEPDMEFYERLPRVIERAESELADIVWRLNKNNKGSALVAQHDPITGATIIQNAHQ